MEFIPVDKEIREVVLNNLEMPPYRLQKILKAYGYRYVVARNGGMVKYIMRPIKDKSKPKIEVKL